MALCIPNHNFLELTLVLWGILWGWGGESLLEVYVIHSVCDSCDLTTIYDDWSEKGQVMLKVKYVNISWIQGIFFFLDSMATPLYFTIYCKLQ